MAWSKATSLYAYYAKSNAVQAIVTSSSISMLSYTKLPKPLPDRNAWLEKEVPIV